MRIINLLPKPRQQEIRYELAFRGIMAFFVISLVTYAFVFAAKFATNVYLKTEAEAIKAEIADLRQQVNKQENAAIKQRIQAVNNATDDFQNLASSSPRWSKVITAFSKVPPSNLKINSFVASRDSKTVNIIGFSPTREAVIQLYNNILADDKEFYNVDYPLENVAKPEDITFHFTFSIRDSLMK